MAASFAGVWQDGLKAGVIPCYKTRTGGNVELVVRTPSDFAQKVMATRDRPAIDALIGPAAEAAPGVEDLEADEATLRELRSGPGGVSLDSLLAELAKLRRIRALGLPADLFDDVAPKAVEAYRQRAAASLQNAVLLSSGRKCWPFLLPQTPMSDQCRSSRT